MPQSAKRLGLFHVDAFNPDLRTVQGVEIFRAGEWNGDDYTTEDLDAMVDAFSAVGFQVPLKMGHAEGEGMPACGWVSRVYRVGDVLKADFKDIPWYLFDAVFTQHAYDHVSCEIYFNLKRDGKTYKRVLKAVALLGAETPAVSGLAPLRDATYAPDASTFEKVALASLEVDPMPEPVAQKQNTETVTPAQFQELQAQLAQATKAIETLTNAGKKADETNTALLSQIATLQATNKAAAVDAKVSKVKLPALVEHFRHLFGVVDGSKVVKFKAADGKEADKTLETVLDEIVDQVNKFAAGFTGNGKLTVLSNHNPTLETPAKDASEEVAAKVEAHLKANPALKGKDGYQAATAAVLEADPDLKARYRAFTLGQNAA